MVAKYVIYETIGIIIIPSKNCEHLLSTQNNGKTNLNGFLKRYGFQVHAPASLPKMYRLYSK